MRISLKISALLAMLLLAFTVVGGTGVGAQDAEEELQMEDFEGIQHGVGRNYSIDYTAMMDAVSTPGAELGMPGGLKWLSGVILEFDNDDNAEAGLEMLNEAGMTQMAGEDSDVEEVDLDLGDKSFGYAGTEDIGGQSMDMVFAIVQKDNYVYFVVAGGVETDVQATVTDFTNKLIENDGSGEGEFNEDGTSTGGLWDKFPAADDDLVSGLIAYDQVIFPEPEASPES